MREEDSDGQRQYPTFRQIRVVAQLRKWVLGTELIAYAAIHGARTAHGIRTYRAVAGRKLDDK